MNVRDLGPALLAAVALAVLSVNAVAAIRRRSRPREAGDPAGDAAPWYYDGLVRIRLQQEGRGSLRPSLGMRLRVGESVIHITPPPWQYVRGLSSEWHLPTAETTMSVHESTVVLRGPGVVVSVTGLRRGADIAAALSRAHVPQVPPPDQEPEGG